nr:hypothetical protein [Marinicella sp. W31]MDC2875790.1 hypothetical protein [Marinicella sp. W31]
MIETGAGFASGIDDDAFRNTGAEIAGPDAASSADVIFKVRRPEPHEFAAYKNGAIVVAMMDPYGNEEALGAMAEKGFRRLPWN